MKQRTLAIAAVLLALAAAWALYSSALPSPADEYPDPPFTPYPKDAPWLTPPRECPPDSDEAGVSSYWDEVTENNRRLTQNGALSRATPEERAAVAQVEAKKFVGAREKAEAILKKRVSLPALYCMGVALAEGESSLASGLFRLRTLRHIVHRRGLVAPDDAHAREWYLRGLAKEIYYLQLLNRPEEHLRAVQLMEKLLGPQPQLRTFELEKVGRSEEAARTIDDLERTGRWPITAFNSRLILENDRTKAYELGKKLATMPHTSALLWRNRYGDCLRYLQIEEAEKALLRSARFQTIDYYGNAYIPLTELYLEQARFGEAWRALSRGRAQRLERDIETLAQDQRELDASASTLLLTLGKQQEALRFARRGHDDPGRLGYRIVAEETARLGNAAICWVVVHASLAELRERPAWNLPAKLALESEQWALQKEMLRCCTTEDRLAKLLMPYGSQRPWLISALFEALPDGAFAEALRRARLALTLPAAGPYFDALDAQLQLRRGRAAEALAQARKALDGLPAEGQKLLRAMVSTIAAKAARARGDRAGALAYFDSVLQHAPIALRLLDAELPVNIQSTLR